MPIERTRIKDNEIGYGFKQPNNSYCKVILWGPKMGVITYHPKTAVRKPYEGKYNKNRLGFMKKYICREWLEMVENQPGKLMEDCHQLGVFLHNPCIDRIPAWALKFIRQWMPELVYFWNNETRSTEQKEKKIKPTNEEQFWRAVIAYNMGKEGIAWYKTLSIERRGHFDVLVKFAWKNKRENQLSKFLIKWKEGVRAIFGPGNAELRNKMGNTNERYQSIHASIWNLFRHHRLSHAVIEEVARQDADTQTFQHWKPNANIVKVFTILGSKEEITDFTNLYHDTIRMKKTIYGWNEETHSRWNTELSQLSSLQELQAAHDEAVVEMNHYRAATAAARGEGDVPQERAHLSPWQCFAMGNEQIKWIANETELEAESESMHHCVSAYLGACSSGELSVYHTEFEKEKGTLGIQFYKDSANVIQYQGVNNRDMSEISKANVRMWLHDLGFNSNI